jgi:hypothetical protein
MAPIRRRELPQCEYRDTLTFEYLPTPRIDVEQSLHLAPPTATNVCTPHNDVSERTAVTDVEITLLG